MIFNRGEGSFGVNVDNTPPYASLGMADFLLVRIPWEHSDAVGANHVQGTRGCLNFSFPFVHAFISFNWRCAAQVQVNHPCWMGLVSATSLGGFDQPDMSAKVDTK